MLKFIIMSAFISWS